MKMEYGRIYRIIDYKGTSLYDQTKNITFYVSSLYQASKGVNVDSLLLRDANILLESLTLPKRVSVYESLLQEGKESLENGFLKEGTDWYATAQYFRNEFVVKNSKKGRSKHPFIKRIVLKRKIKVL